MRTLLIKCDRFKKIFIRITSQKSCFIYMVCSCFLCGIFLIRSGLWISPPSKERALSLRTLRNKAPLKNFLNGKFKIHGRRSEIRSETPRVMTDSFFFFHNDRNEIGFSLRKHPFHPRSSPLGTFRAKRPKLQRARRNGCIRRLDWFHPSVGERKIYLLVI